MFILKGHIDTADTNPFGNNNISFVELFLVRCRKLQQCHSEMCSKLCASDCSIYLIMLALRTSAQTVTGYRANRYITCSAYLHYIMAVRINRDSMFLDILCISYIKKKIVISRMDFFLLILTVNATKQLYTRYSLYPQANPKL